MKRLIRLVCWFGFGVLLGGLSVTAFASTGTVFVVQTTAGENLVVDSMDCKTVGEALMRKFDVQAPTVVHLLSGCTQDVGMPPSLTDVHWEEFEKASGAYLGPGSRGMSSWPEYTAGFGPFPLRDITAANVSYVLTWGIGIILTMFLFGFVGGSVMRAIRQT